MSLQVLRPTHAPGVVAAAVPHADHQHRICKQGSTHAPAGCGTSNCQVGGAEVSYLVDPAPRPAAPAEGRPLRRNTAVASQGGPLLGHAWRCAWFSSTESFWMITKMVLGLTDQPHVLREELVPRQWNSALSCGLLQLPTAASNVRGGSTSWLRILVVSRSRI